MADKLIVWELDNGRLHFITPPDPPANLIGAAADAWNEQVKTGVEDYFASTPGCDAFSFPAIEFSISGLVPGMLDFMKEFNEAVRLVAGDLVYDAGVFIDLMTRRVNSYAKYLQETVAAATTQKIVEFIDGGLVDIALLIPGITFLLVDIPAAISTAISTITSAAASFPPDYTTIFSISWPSMPYGVIPNFSWEELSGRKFSCFALGNFI